MPALMANIDSQTTEQHDRHRLIGGQAAHKPRGHLTRHHRAGRERVITGDHWIIRRGRDEHPRAATTAMTLQRMLTQPVIERAHSTPEALGVVPCLQRDGLVKAHELIKHAVRRQQTRELRDRASRAI